MVGFMESLVEECNKEEIMADEKEGPVGPVVPANFPQVCFKCSRLIHHPNEAEAITTKNGDSVAHKECAGK